MWCVDDRKRATVAVIRRVMKDAAAATAQFLVLIRTRRDFLLPSFRHGKTKRDINSWFMARSDS